MLDEIKFPEVHSVRGLCRFSCISHTVRQSQNLPSLYLALIWFGALFCEVAERPSLVWTIGFSVLA